MTKITLPLIGLLACILTSCDMMTMPWNRDYTCTCFSESGMAIEYEFNDMPYRDAERMCNNLEQIGDTPWFCNIN